MGHDSSWFSLIPVFNDAQHWVQEKLGLSFLAKEKVTIQYIASAVLVMLLAFLMVLVVACTLAQVRLGTIGAVNLYMRSWFYWMPLGSLSIPIFPGYHAWITRKRRSRGGFSQTVASYQLSSSRCALSPTQWCRSSARRRRRLSRQDRGLAPPETSARAPCPWR